MSRGLKIIKSGILTTIQDQGRFGYQGSGFPTSGCMDKRAMHDANVLVNNPVEYPLLEMLLQGITAEFEVHTYFAVTGAAGPMTLNGKTIKPYTTYEVKSGDCLEMGMAAGGRFSYLAVAGGFRMEPVLGSFSTNLKCKIGGFEGRGLMPGDVLEIPEYNVFFINHYLKEMNVPEYLTSVAGSENGAKEPVNLHVIAGPQDDYFTEKGKETFSTQIYSVSEKSDRMGYRMDGAAIEYKDGVDILSDGIVFGSIQVPPDGKPMVLMADRQTTGGYAKIGTVISADLPKLAQCLPGAEVRFEFVDMKSAEKQNRIADREMRRFRRKCGYRKTEI